MRGRLDDILLGTALALAAALCLAFRYLPMVDLPQHYAMVSILPNFRDPAYGFADRYVLDFGRPYLSVYLLAAALAKLMPLAAAMRIVVAISTIAPLCGAWALLRALERPRFWLLPSLPLAFGAIWHWGFLNFLCGTGLALGGLALVVRVARGGRRPIWTLAALALLLLFTHLHALAMLLACAPLVAWGLRGEASLRSAWTRTAIALLPSALGLGVFAALTWARERGTWEPMSPGFVERIGRLAEDLTGGAPDPWPAVWLAIAGVWLAGGLAFALAREARPRSERIALGAALVLQLALYFALPLSTRTVAFVSPRHALFAALLAVALMPSLAGAAATVLRAAGVAIALLALVVCARELACFDREARDFDAALAAMQPNRRVVPLVFDRAGACTPPRAFPYLHFDAYYQAARGGDLAHSFALAWNMPVRYRDGAERYRLRESVEWSPQQFSPNDLPHFDYLLVRSRRPPRFPDDWGVRQVVQSGEWTLWENPAAQR